jgi:spermidine synthase
MVERYVLVSAFLAGAITLVVEILGTRIMSPYYGASIYVWSSLIGVTLGALTVGYLAGGAAADRWPPLLAFALEIVGGALCLLLVPAIRGLVLSATTPLGLRLGSLVSAIVLFAPPLVLLSMTGPSAIRLVTSDFSVLGRGVGKVYGVSTLGSTIGAITTGFVLIPSFAVPTLLVACAVILLLLGATGLLLVRQPLGSVAAVAAAFLGIVADLGGTPHTRGLVYAGNSFYGEIKVFDAKDARLLMIDGIDNGSVDRTTFEAQHPYIAAFRYLPAARPAATRALCIGLGAGSVPRSLHLHHQIATDVVEIDPEIARVARDYFGFPADVPVHVEDGRTFVGRTTQRYDLVVLDAFRAEAHPAHLFTREFFAQLDAILADDGIVAINMGGLPYGTGSTAWRSVRKTLLEPFIHVRAFAGESNPETRAGVTNVFVVASDGTLPDPGTLGNDPVLATLAINEIPLGPGDEQAIVLTDDYDPIEHFDRNIMVSWREERIRRMQSLLLLDAGS